MMKILNFSSTRAQASWMKFQASTRKFIMKKIETTYILISKTEGRYVEILAFCSDFGCDLHHIF